MTSPPTTTAMLIATAIVAALSGYMIGIASSLGFLPIPFSSHSSTLPSTKRFSTYDNEEESSEEEVEGLELDHAPNWLNGLQADKRDGLRSENAGLAKHESTVQEKKKQDFVLKSDMKECKLVLVVRSDLGMTKGKIAAQCSHATLACYKNFLKNDPNSDILRCWEREGQTKVALKVDDESEMLVLYAKAMSICLVAEIIQDAGRTQIASGSQTVLGLGPAPSALINQVTGKLKLL